MSSWRSHSRTHFRRAGIKASPTSAGRQCRVRRPFSLSSPGPPVSTMLCLMVFALFSAAGAASAARPEAMQCGPCNPNRCPAIGHCHRGITWDVCNCCEVCAKGLDEECGGPWGAYGKCGYGLTCLKDARECPYLFHPRGSGADTGSNICDDYLFNAIGRCVRSEETVDSAFKRKGMIELQRDETDLEPGKNPLQKGDAIIGKRLMLKGVLRGVEY